MGLLTLNINSFFLFYLISFLIILSCSTRSHPMMVPLQDFYFLLFIFPDLYDLQFFTTKSFRASGSRTFYQLKKKNWFADFPISCLVNFCFKSDFFFKDFAPNNKKFAWRLIRNWKGVVPLVVVVVVVNRRPGFESR